MTGPSVFGASSSGSSPSGYSWSKTWRNLWNIFGILLVVASAWFLWPTSLGGRTQFVIVHGNSMEPLFHNGDLLYTRQSSDYSVDDVAVYSIPDGDPGGGSLVVHRISAIDGQGRFTLTGDNRQTADAAHPELEDMVARPVRNLGQIPTRLIILTPLILSLILGAAVAWFLWPQPNPPFPPPESQKPKDTIEEETVAGEEMSTAKKRELASIV